MDTPDLDRLTILECAQLLHDATLRRHGEMLDAHAGPWSCCETSWSGRSARWRPTLRRRTGAPARPGKRSAAGSALEDEQRPTGGGRGRMDFDPLTVGQPVRRGRTDFRV